MNILISKYCNRRCTFCFARQRLGVNASNAGSEQFMSRENLRKIITILKRTGETDLRLLGGEPTLHPEFVDIVKEAMAEGLNVHIFTNGMMPAETADFLAGLPADRFSMLCNVSPQANDTPKLKEKLNYALSRLNTRAKVGITITGFDETFDDIIETIDRYKLQRRVRVGIAQPIVGQDNAYLDPADYRRAGTFIVELAEKFHRHDILMGFDCGMTLCMFDEAQIGRLFTITEGFKMHCSPIIDVGPDMDVWHCFPLSELLPAHIDQFKIRKDMVAHFQRITKPYRSLGCRPECLRCKFLQTHQCSGGCLAHTMKALQRKPAAGAAAS